MDQIQWYGPDSDGNHLFANSEPYNDMTRLLYIYVDFTLSTSWMNYGQDYSGSN
jgi:hypothetical protein